VRRREGAGRRGAVCAHRSRRVAVGISGSGAAKAAARGGLSGAPPEARTTAGSCTGAGSKHSRPILGRLLDQRTIFLIQRFCKTGQDGRAIFSTEHFSASYLRSHFRECLEDFAGYENFAGIVVRNSFAGCNFCSEKVQSADSIGTDVWE